MSLVDKVKGMLAGREGQVRSGLDRAAKVANEKTGGKYSDKIDSVKKKIDDQLGGNEPPAEGEGRKTS